MPNEKILPALSPLVRPIDGITADPSNARRHTIEGIDNLKRSLQHFGQHKPVVVQQREDGTLVCRAGNGLLQAATELGWKNIAAVVVEEDNIMAVTRALQDNKSAEVGSIWDQQVLGNLLTELHNMDIDFLNTGFTTEEFNALRLEPEEHKTEPESLDVISEAVRSTIVISVPSPEGAEVKRMIDELLQQEQVSDYEISLR